MFKLIEKLGKFVVKMYFKEAKTLMEHAKESAKVAKFHDGASKDAREVSIQKAIASAKVAAKAQKLKELL